MALFFRSNFLMILNSWSLCSMGKLMKTDLLYVISMLIISHTSSIKICDGLSQPLALFLTSRRRCWRVSLRFNSLLQVRTVADTSLKKVRVFYFPSVIRYRNRPPQRHRPKPGCSVSEVRAFTKAASSYLLSVQNQDLAVLRYTRQTTHPGNFLCSKSCSVQLLSLALHNT